MAFPQVEQIKESSSGASDVDPLVASYPDTCVAGELLLALINIDSAVSGGGTDINLTAGWTLLFTFQEISIQSFEVWAKIAIGDEDGTTFNIDLEGVQQGVVQLYRISAWFGTIATGVAVSTRADSDDPPSLTAPWGVLDTLWIVVAFTSGAVGAPGTWPSGFTTGQTFTSSAVSSAGAQIASARREEAVETKDPGAFTSYSAGADTLTIAIRPADNPFADMAASIEIAMTVDAPLVGVADMQASIDTGVGVTADMQPAAEIAASLDIGVTLDGVLEPVSEFVASLDIGITITATMEVTNGPLVILATSVKNMMPLDMAAGEMSPLDLRIVDTTPLVIEN